MKQNHVHKIGTAGHYYNAAWFNMIIAYSSEVIEATFQLTSHTPHLTLSVELWGVICKDFGEN